MTAPSRSLVIPMKDEAARLGDSLHALQAAGFGDGDGDAELVLVDDGSADATPELASRLLEELSLRGRVVRLPRNVGKGGAIAAGVAVAVGDVIAFVDADLSTPPAVVEQAFELVEAGKADVVVSTRVHPEANLTALPSLGRRYGGRAYNILLRVLGLSTLSDTQCGLKAFRSEVARALFADLRCPRFAFDVDVLSRAEHSDITVLELPVEWAHADDSKVHLLRDGSRMVADTLRLRWAWRRGIPEVTPPSDADAGS
jgi:dolichyl-phosphate beta-glucosyltransferase